MGEFDPHAVLINIFALNVPAGPEFL